MRIKIAGALVIIVGVLIMAGAIILGIFAGPFDWKQIALLVLLFIVGLEATLGGSDMKE